jgi:hypothetical protein
MSERAKVTGSERDSPGSIEKWPMLQAKQKVSVKVEDVNVTQPRTMVLVV